MKLKKQDIPFTMVANVVLCDKTLSWQAKGLYAYLFSKPDGWDFAAKRIAEEGKEERKMVMRTLNELENAKLLTRKRMTNGRMEYHVTYSQFENTTEASEIKPIILPEANNQIAEIIDAFKIINPIYKKWFGNNTQRAAADRLIQSHGLEQTLKVISILPQSNNMDYMPRITSPLKLEDKWADLAIALKSKKTALQAKQIVQV